MPDRMFAFLLGLAYGLYAAWVIALNGWRWGHIDWRPVRLRIEELERNARAREEDP